MTQARHASHRHLRHLITPSLLDRARGDNYYYRLRRKPRSFSAFILWRHLSSNHHHRQLRFPIHTYTPIHTRARASFPALRARCVRALYMYNSGIRARAGAQLYATFSFLSFFSLSLSLSRRAARFNTRGTCPENALTGREGAWTRSPLLACLYLPLYCRSLSAAHCRSSSRRVTCAPVSYTCARARSGSFALVLSIFWFSLH